MIRIYPRFIFIAYRKRKQNIKQIFKKETEQQNLRQSWRMGVINVFNTYQDTLDIDNLKLKASIKVCDLS